LPRRPDPLPASVTPQLATLVDGPPVRGEWTYEIKFDGYRILARCDDGNVRLFTRNSNDWTDKMPTLARELATMPVETAWLDGEIVVQDTNGLPDFNALQNAFDKRQGDRAMTYFVFDLLYVDGRDLRRLDQRTRRAALEALIARHEQGHVRLSQAFEADGASVLQSACKMGLEGIIAKRLDSPYKGVRDQTWLKIKCQRRQEFVVGGFAARAGSGKEVGTLMLGVYDDQKRLRYAGSVGTGWKSAQAVALLAELAGLETDAMPFHPDYPPNNGRWSKRKAGGERWAQPRMVVEVSFVEWTPDGHIRHPTFRGVRRDKKAEQIRREQGG
jgi:bifunctional non-homologous end joining protein LigD